MANLAQRIGSEFKKLRDEELVLKQDKETGKSLIEDTKIAKLDGIEEGANNYVLPTDVVQDSTYVHTDNNFDNTSKLKLEGIEEGAQVNPVNVSELTNDAGYITVTDVQQNFTETITNLTKVGNELRYENENGEVQVVDLSVYLDDTNLSKITEAYVMGDYLYFKRDDFSSFRVDVTAFLAQGVSSINGEIGDVTIDKTTLNLENVDNTSDLDKPISNATQVALDGKVDDNQVLTNVPAGAVFTDTTYENVSEFTNDAGYITENSVSFEVLDAKGDVGTGSNQVAAGNHTHEVTEISNFAEETRMAVSEVTFDSKGFPNRVDTSLTFDAGTRIVTLAPTGSSFDIFYRGKKFTFTSPLTKEITNMNGGRYIVFNPETQALEELVIGAHPSLKEDLLVAYIYWNYTEQEAIIFGDERHSSDIDVQWHLSQHLDVGAVWRSGGGISYTLDDSSNSKFGIATPLTIADEDLVHVINHSDTPTNDYEQILETEASLPTISISGTTTRQLNAATTWSQGPYGIYYNQFNGSSYSYVSVPENEYMCYWIVATNDSIYPVKKIMGKNAYATISEAEAEEFESHGFVVPEIVPLYKIILKSVTRNLRAEISGVYTLTGRKSTMSSSFSANSHTELSDRGAADQHPISAITGLQTELDGKLESADLSTVATTGDYADLSNVPTNVSEFTNDAGYITSADVQGNVTETNTSLILSGTNLVYTDEEGTNNSISLAGFLDDTTNTVVSGVLSNGVITFTREDATTFQIDVSSLEGGAVSSVNGLTGDITVQETLVSGTNIKTVNGESLLGSGNITIEGGTGGTASVVPRYVTALIVNKTDEVPNGANIFSFDMPFYGSITEIRVKTFSGTCDVVINNGGNEVDTITATVNGVKSTELLNVDFSKYQTVSFDIANSAAFGLEVSIISDEIEPATLTSLDPA